MRSVAGKNDNSVCLHFLIMSPDSHYNFISGLYPSNHLKYLNDSLEDYTAGQHRESHARMPSLLFFIFKLSPLINMLNSFLARNSVSIGNNLMKLGKIIKRITAAVACRYDNFAYFIL